MNPERWQRIRHLFDRCSETSSPDALLDAECGDDPALRVEVETLLALRRKPDLAADTPIFKLATGLPAASAREGDEIGEYRITRYLAAGGMGEVYAAVQRKTGEAVALKLLREFSNVARDRERVRARFEREAALASRVRHPNVCRMIEVDLQAEPPFCVMELLEGETLAERLSRVGKLSVEEALEMTAGICEGLQAAHQAGVIHRDLKPGNIFLLAGTNRPVIIDFGLATAMHRDLALTKSGEMLGTLAYIAPEILEENREMVGPPSDLYSLGVILFEMLTGKKPHTSDSPLRLVMQRARRTDLLPAMRNLGLPDVWLEVIARCLESDPKKRYASAREVRYTLQAGRASWRFQLSNPRVRVGIAAALLAVVGLAGWQLWTSDYAPEAEAASLFRQARQAVRDSAPKRAVGLLEQAVARDPGFLHAHSLLAFEYADLDQLDKAREQMLKATEASDRRWRGGPLERRAMEASRAAVIGDYVKSAEILREAGSKSSGDRMFFDLSAAEMLWQAGKTGEVTQISERLVREDPGNVAVKVLYGRTLCRRRKFREAAAEFDAAERAYRAAGNLEGLATVLLAKVANLRQEDDIDRRNLGEVRQLANQTGNTHHDLLAVFRLALLAVSDDRVDEAIQMGTQAVTRAQSAGMNGIASRALGDIGYALYIARKQQEALRFLEQGLELAQRSKSSSAEASNRMRLSEVLFSAPFRRVKDAISTMEPAVGWYRQAGHEDVLSNVLVKWGGMLLNDPARLAEGEKILIEAMERGEREGDQTIQLMATQRLAGFYGSRNLPKSLQYWQRGLPVIRAMGVGVAMAQIGRTYSFFGDFNSAKAMFAELDEVIAKLPAGYNRRNLEAWSAREQAMARYREGVCIPFPGIPFDPPYAIEYHALVDECRGASHAVLEQHRRTAANYAVDFERRGGPNASGRLWNLAARLSAALGDWEQAAKHALHARGICSNNVMRLEQIESELILRKALQARRRPGEAAAAEERALRLAREVGFPAPFEKFNGRRDLQRLWKD
jgi:serine/threonine protein kinase/Tfp pilus assembly protein PilF